MILFYTRSLFAIFPLGVLYLFLLHISFHILFPHLLQLSYPFKHFLHPLEWETTRISLWRITVPIEQRRLLNSTSIGTVVLHSKILFISHWLPPVLAMTFKQLFLLVYLSFFYFLCLEFFYSLIFRFLAPHFKSFTLFRFSIS